MGRLDDIIVPGATAAGAEQNVVSLLHGQGKGVPVFLLRSDAPPPLHAISEAGHIADIMKGRPDSWTPRHHAAAPGRRVQAFVLLQNTESPAPGAIFQTQKMLTKRPRAATAVIISCWFKAGEVRSAMNVEKMSKEQLARAQRRRKESAGRRRHIKVHMKYDGKAAVRQQDASRAAALRSGSSNTKPQSQTQRNAAGAMKRNEHFNLNLLLKRTQKRLPFKAASDNDDDDDDDDGLHVERRLLLKTGPTRRPPVEIKATQDANEVDLNEDIVTQRAERSQTNADANGNQRRLASILQASFTHETDNNDVETKQALAEAGGDVLITLFLPDTDGDAQTGPSSRLNTETIKTSTTKVPRDPPPGTNVMKECVTIDPESLCSLQMCVAGRTERISLRPAERREATTASDSTRVEETTAHTQTNNLPAGNMSINHTKQEGNAASEESAIPPPPSLKVTERETVTTERAAETTTGSTEMKEPTWSTDVLHHGPASTENPGAEAGCVGCKAGRGEAPGEKAFSGLRMREDVPARAVTDGPEPDRPAVLKDAEGNWVAVAKPFPTTREGAEDTPAKAASGRPALCGGLIHRTEAGRRHCAERAARMVSTDALKHPREEEEEEEEERIREQSHNPLHHDRFYYFEGSLS
ncbi:uncharacterized protein [Clinocottus analis]|uniref:uncharacterized protein n=1 Tax=Clinocottus analis TaxID=304258 RepID=UPI0035C00597